MAFALTSTNIRLDGTNIRAKCQKSDGQKVDSALDLNKCFGNKDGNFNLGDGAFGASARNIRLDGSTLHADLLTIQQALMHRTVDLNICIANSNGVLTFAKPKERITQSCAGLFLQDSILKGLCLGPDGKLHPSTIDLTSCYGNHNGSFAPGDGAFFKTARNIKLQLVDGKAVLRGQLKDHIGSWCDAEVDISRCIVNANGKFAFVKDDGRFDKDGAVTLLSERIPFVRAFVSGLNLLAGNEEWAKRVVAFCSNSPIICVGLVMGTHLGGPIGAAIGGGIVTPIDTIVESAIAGTIKDPVLKGQFEEATVGRFVYETLKEILAPSGPGVVAELGATLTGPVLDTAVAQMKEALRGPGVAVAVTDIGSSQLVKKIIDAVSKNQMPQDWLDTLAKVEKLKHA